MAATGSRTCPALPPAIFSQICTGLHCTALRNSARSPLSAPRGFTQIRLSLSPATAALACLSWGAPPLLSRRVNTHVIQSVLWAGSQQPGTALCTKHGSSVLHASTLPSVCLLIEYAHVHARRTRTQHIHPSRVHACLRKRKHTSARARARARAHTHMQAYPYTGI